MTIVSLFKFGSIIYTIFAVILAILLFIIRAEFKKEAQVKQQRRCTIGIVALVMPLVIFAMSWVDAKYIEPDWIQVDRVTVRSKMFPREIEKVRMVHLSDLHIENVGKREKSLIRKVNALMPDLIFITGDFITSRAGLSPCLEVLSQLNAKLGIYATLGNHDYYHFFKEKELVDELKKAGVIVLTRGNALIFLPAGGRLWAVGISHRYAYSLERYDTKSFEQAFSNIPSGDPKILMIHNPDIADAGILKRLNPQLILAGHTHGGQFGVPVVRKFYWYAERSKYMAGLFRVKGIPLYVNRGIGMITKQLRFMCRPEITVIKLKSK